MPESGTSQANNVNNSIEMLRDTLSQLSGLIKEIVVPAAKQGQGLRL
ncbi:hypothetical protein ACQV2C_19495 [Pantoea allii]